MGLPPRSHWYPAPPCPTAPFACTHSHTVRRLWVCVTRIRDEVYDVVEDSPESSEKAQ